MSTLTLPTNTLQTISDKVHKGLRLTRDEGMYLFKTPHESIVYDLANLAREMRVGNKVYFASTLFIHPTNLCELSCPFCSFYAKPGWKNAWFMTPEDIRDKVKAHLDEINEVHFVGGLWKECNLQYYKKAFAYIHELNPNLHIKALDAIEYDYLAKIENLPLESIFEKMKSFGLGSLPGGGAEVLVESVRKKIAPQKITSQQYLDVHRKAHKAGLKSNVTMLFNHIEEEEDLIDHMIEVRNLQDETGGYKTFVPLLYHTENNPLGKRKARLKPKNVKKVYAISRLMLDNVPHLKVLWNYLGIDTALDILDSGGNDLASTAIGEKIIVMAGGVRLNMTKETLKRLIEEKGKIAEHIHSGSNY